jgi:lipopolysaccharide exporter
MLSLLRGLFRPGDRVSHQAFNAGAWASMLRVAMRMLIFLRTLVLARLLAPDDFGLMAIATVVLLLFDQLTQPGFDAALVQRRGDVRDLFDTAWTFQVARSAAIGAVMVVAAPLIAGFFNAPESESILRVLSLAVVIRGLASISVVDIQRELAFDRYFVVEMSDWVIDVVVSIIAAVILGNVWALVLGVLAGAIARTATSYAIHPYRPRFRWVGVHARDLFRFGKWVMISSILAYITLNLDDILVGRMVGVAALGFYRMAYNFSQAPASEFSAVTSQVAFPTYSKLQDDLPRLRRAFLGTFHLVAFIALPLAAGTALVADDLTIGLLGPKWAPMIGALELLCIVGAVRALSGATGPLYAALDKLPWATGFTLVGVIILSIVVVPLINWGGIDGAAASVAIAAVVSAIGPVTTAYRLVRATFADVVQSLLFPALNTAIMALFVFGTRSILPNRPSAISFFVLAAVGMVVYFGSATILVRTGRYQSPKDLMVRLRELGA